MALMKSIPTEFGVSATYWNIGAKQEDFKGKGIEVTMYGFASEDARREGKNPMSVGRFQIVGNEYVPDMSREDIYAMAKLRPEFIGSEDI